MAEEQNAGTYESSQLAALNDYECKLVFDSMVFP